MSRTLMRPRPPRPWWRRLARAVPVLALLTWGLAALGPAAPAQAALPPVVTAGGGHSCALMPDQSVWCWGQNLTSQLGNGATTDSLVPVHVAGLPAATDVSGGHDHTCAVDTAAAVWCWGANAFGELGNGTTSVDSTTPVTATGIQALQVSTGDGFSCAITLTHTVQCWGDNNFGELGNGNYNDASTPVPVKKLTNVTQIAAGFFHACAREANGTVWCWGDNGDGELGVGTTPVTSNKPVEVPLENATYVAAGNSGSCAIVGTAGDLLCWGANNVGQLGVGDFAPHPSPTQVASLNSGVSQVGLGEDFGCAIAATPGPTAVCWGDADGNGQLGDGNFTEQDPFPTAVFGLQALAAGGTAGPSQIAVGGHHACVVMSTGKIECWGKNLTGALGTGTTLNHAIPTPTIGLPGPPNTANAVTGGTKTSCAVTATADAACWGQMAGDGGPLLADHTSAVAVHNLPTGGVSQVTAGDGGCALVRLGGLSTGVRCWGDNTWGELGNNTTSPAKAAVKVQGLPGQVQAIASGGTHVCALVHNGGARCWGLNNDGQLGDGTTTNRSVAVTVKNLPLNMAQIAAADDHTCALLSNGTMECWGLNNDGQLGDGTTSNRSTPVAVTGLTSVVQIALGDAFTCALIGNGQVDCWGFNALGQLGNGTTTNSGTPGPVNALANVETLSTSDAGGCAVLLSGHVACWGDNSHGELGNGSVGGQSTSPVTVQTGGGTYTSDGASIGLGPDGAVSCSLDASEMAECWGQNNDGELGDGATSDSGVAVVVQGL